MVGDQARLCVFEIHAAQDSVLVRFALNARDGSPTIDGATAFYLNRCLLLGPGAPRLYPQAEDVHPFPLVSPTLGPWNYRLVRPTDPEYEAECGLLRKAKFLGEGYVLGQPDKPVDAPVAADTPHASVADQAAADGSLDLGDDPAPAPTIQRERGG